MLLCNNIILDVPFLLETLYVVIQLFACGTIIKVHNKNQSKYVWPNRIDATVYECLNQNIAEQVFIMLDVDTNTSKEIIEKVNATSELNLSVKMNKFDPLTTDFLKNDLSKGRNIPYEKDKKHNKNNKR